MKSFSKIVINTAALLTVVACSSDIKSVEFEDEQIKTHPVEKPYWWWSYCDYDIKHPELQYHGYFIDDGYDLIYDSNLQRYIGETICWWGDYNKKEKTVEIEFEDLVTPQYEKPWFSDQTVRIPDTINGYTVIGFYKSCAFKAFDVNPENQYFKSDGTALFSKDGKRLISYARFNGITEYTVPKGTEVIENGAIWACDNLKRVYIPDSVKKIEKFSVAQNDLLDEIIFDSFKIKIDRSAFGRECTMRLICTQKNELSSNGNYFLWEKIPDASYYEVYQKLNNGEYKLLKTTKATACKFTTLKSGKKYTFAVKPVAVIPAANYDKEKDEGNYPETFTIEGTMSEDIVVKG